MNMVRHTAAFLLSSITVTSVANAAWPAKTDLGENFGATAKSWEATMNANKQLVRHLFEEWINRKNLAAVDQMLTPDYVDHEYGLARGSEGTKAFLTALYAAFPDIQVKIEDILADADKVVVRNTWRGTHQGTFRGIAPTGKSVTIKGIVIWRIADGKVAERWATIDYLSLMQQLGALPNPK
jgi:steroid delta-isomerase-like uncharacterized protein